jgi:hypothetical protein
MRAHCRLFFCASIACSHCQIQVAGLRSSLTAGAFEVQRVSRARETNPTVDQLPCIQHVQVQVFTGKCHTVGCGAGRVPFTCRLVLSIRGRDV